MEYSFGRFCFLCLVGSLALGYGTWGIVAGVCAFAAAILNVRPLPAVAHARFSRLRLVSGTLVHACL